MIFSSPKSYLRHWTVAMMAILTLSLASCSDDPILSSQNSITSFLVTGMDVSVKSDTFTISVRRGVDVSKLAPAIEVSEGATVSPASGEVQDFSKAGGVVYTVTAANGTQKQYVVAVAYLAGLKAFSVSIVGTAYTGVIDPVAKTITIPVDFDNVSLRVGVGEKFVTRATLLDGCRIEPASGSVISLDNPADQVVVDEVTGVSERYKVIMLNTDTHIDSLVPVLPGLDVTPFSSNTAYWSRDEYTAGLATSDFVIMVLTTDDVSHLAMKPRADWAIAKRCTVVPALSEPQDFTKDVTYTVTAEAGNKRTFKVRVVSRKFIWAAENNQKDSYFNVPAKELGAQFSYRSVSPIKSVKLIAEDTGKEYALSFSIWRPDPDKDGSVNDILLITLDPKMEGGYYKLYVTLENGDAFLTTARVRRNI